VLSMGINGVVKSIVYRYSFGDEIPAEIGIDGTPAYVLSEVAPRVYISYQWVQQISIVDCKEFKISKCIPE
jgi:hypothetical protein